MVPASVNEKYVIRFCAVAQNANEEDIGKSDTLFFPFKPMTMASIRYVENI